MNQVKVYVILLVLITTSAFSYSQEYNYHPFPTSNAVWTELYRKSLFEPPPGYIFNQFMLFDEDTIIDGKHYQKLYQTHSSSATKENSFCIGAIREDSLKRVWFYNILYPYHHPPEPLYYHSEILIYDFSLSLGDTIRDFNIAYGNNLLTVSEIDTIMVGKSLRKLFSFYPITWTKWIEGIGNVNGLLFTNGDLPTNGMKNDLICFHEHDTLFLFNKEYDNCVPSFVLNEVEKLPGSNLKVYPNPVNKKFAFFEGLDFDLIELFNNNGDRVFVRDISGKERYRLDVSNFSCGTYYYELTKEGTLPVSGKLLVGQ